MGFPRMGPGNRAIFVAFRSGAEIADLAAEYGLRSGTIAAILTTEKHKCALSPDPEHRVFRESGVSETYAEERAST